MQGTTTMLPAMLAKTEGRVYYNTKVHSYCLNTTPIS
jgi:hypothetical protein